MNTQVQYHEYDILEPLRPFVKVIWSMEGSANIADAPKTRILPDLCFEFVIHFSDPYLTYMPDCNAASLQPVSFFVGQMSQWMEIQPRGRVGLIAARFSALGACHFFPFPMREVANGLTDLRFLLSGQAKDLEEQIQEQRSTLARVAVLQAWLMELLTRHYNPDPALGYCLSLLHLSEGSIQITELARKAGVSNRQLLRRFDDAIGLSPKEFARIARFHKSLFLIETNAEPSLTEVSMSCSYYDQSHFIRDFKQYCGLSPRDYLKNGHNIVH